MNQKRATAWLSIAIILLIIVADQALKIWVKTNMFWHSSIRITDWFYIFFTENNGMAFGMELVGKLFLTLFRIAAVGVIAWYLVRVVREGRKKGFVACLSLVLAGAVGNIIDSIFYGVIFSESTTTRLAELFPKDGGYAGLLHGKVVDMFYFPLIETNWPSWMPFVGGEHFVFFSPVFNLADAAISCGVIALILFYGRYFTSHKADTQQRSA